MAPKAKHRIRIPSREEVREDVIAALDLNEMRQVVCFLEQIILVDDQTLTAGQWPTLTMQECIQVIRGALADGAPCEREEVEAEYRADIATLQSALKDVSADIGIYRV